MASIHDPENWTMKSKACVCAFRAAGTWVRSMVRRGARYSCVRVVGEGKPGHNLAAFQSARVVASLGRVRSGSAPRGTGGERHAAYRSQFLSDDHQSITKLSFLNFFARQNPETRSGMALRTGPGSGSSIVTTISEGGATLYGGSHQWEPNGKRRNALASSRGPHPTRKDMTANVSCPSTA